MPAFGESRGGPFDQSEVTAVVAFMNALAGRSSTTLLAAEGAVIYERSCASCHGPNGDRIPIAPLDAPGFLDTLTDVRIRDAILNGAGSMDGMGGTGRDALTERDATAVASFLRNRVQEQTAASVGRGRDLYVGNCLACHGTTGNGVAEVELSSGSYLTSLGDGRIISAITRGTDGGPAFGVEAGGAFAIPDTAALMAYLKTWGGLNATAALSLGVAGGGGQGQSLFVQNCAPCHGPTGDNVAGVQLRSETFLTQRTREVVTNTIVVGNEKGMPAWGEEAGGPLTEAQVATIVDYLFSSAGIDGTDGDEGSSGGAVTESPFEGQTVAEFFGTKCAACHGADRSGGIGPALLPDRLTEADDFYESTILEGRPGTPMPAWGDQGVTPEQAAALVEFLKEIEGEADSGGAAAGDAAGGDEDGSSAADSSLFDGITVAEFFGTKCAACHGADRSGGIGPALLPDGLTEPDDFYQQTILEGRPGTPMPAWADQGVTPEQAAALVEFLKTDPTDSAASSVTATSSLIGTVPRSGLFGQELFANTCALCHGTDGLAIQACRIGASDWQLNTSYEGFFTRIANGKPSQGMPIWSEKLGGPLSDAQITSVMQYLGELARR